MKYSDLSLRLKIRNDYADFLRWVGNKLLSFADWLERKWTR